MSDETGILYAVEAGVATLTFNRPEKLNALTPELLGTFFDHVGRAAADPEARVILVTGAGRGFCAGLDLSVIGTGAAGRVRRADDIPPPQWGDDIGPSLARNYSGGWNALIRSRKPTIAAINGPAIGGGFCLAMATDIRVAAHEAYFRAAGINNGLTAAELGLSFTLPRAIGSSRAFEIMLSGRDVDSEEAERIGLVARRCPRDQLLETCYAMAERIAGYSQVGVELTKQMLWAGLEAGSMHAHMNHEGHAQLFVRMTTRNFEEAIRARKEKRKPEFKD